MYGCATWYSCPTVQKPTWAAHFDAINSAEEKSRRERLKLPLKLKLWSQDRTQSWTSIQSDIIVSTTKVYANVSETQVTDMIDSTKRNWRWILAQRDWKLFKSGGNVWRDGKKISSLMLATILIGSLRHTTNVSLYDVVQEFPCETLCSGNQREAKIAKLHFISFHRSLRTSFYDRI